MTSPGPRAGRPGATALVLWDIDLTLVNAGGLGPVARATMLSRLGADGQVVDVPGSGRTDAWILREVLVANGMAPTAERLSRAAAELTQAYRELDTRLRSETRPMPGAVAMMQRLDQVPGVAQSVLTGNLREIARQKLHAAGLSDYLRLDAGAYGDTATDRADLVPAAWAAARRAFGLHAVPPTVIVGDTVHDVLAASAHGVPSVAVAADTRQHHALTAAGAAVVLESLEPAPHVASVILGLLEDRDAG